MNTLFVQLVYDLFILAMLLSLYCINFTRVMPQLWVRAAGASLFFCELCIPFVIALLALYQFSGW